MNDFKKTILIYGILQLICIVTSCIIKISEPDYILFSLIEIAVMLFLLRIFNVSRRSIIIFFCFFTVLMTMIAIDSKALFSKYAEYGIYIPELKFNLEIDVLLILITLPLRGIFVLLKQNCLLEKAYYIVPLIMFIMLTISIVISKIHNKEKKKTEILFIINKSTEVIILGILLMAFGIFNYVQHIYRYSEYVFFFSGLIILIIGFFIKDND